MLYSAKLKYLTEEAEPWKTGEDKVCCWIFTASF